MEPAMNPNPADVSSIDAIVTAAYDVISGPAAKERDWTRLRSLFIAGARLIPTSKETDGDDGHPAAKQERLNRSLMPNVLDVEGFIARVEPFFEKSGFYEKEIARRTQRFGQIAHAWSTYESRHSATDAEPFMRGINSIQLFDDGRRWWIVGIYWQQETAESPIPDDYLSGII
jgi:hypothetical protein